NLIIVGDENFKAGDNKNIKTLPWQYDRSEVKKIFTKAKIVVVPSLYLDPFPTVNLEAMAASRPVVGTCFGGTPEVVVDNETGHIVNPYDEKKLIEKIIDLLENPDRMKLFGSNGRKRIEKFFSLEKQIQETLTIYNKLLMKKKQ
ncbi:MAG: glycosyltransferase family 4 protein, partial [Patescibacteria group bacterium]